MAYPTIIFHSSQGTDVAASGAGPATAVTGTAAAHTGGIASTTITLTNSPDLSGVLTDGSHCLWMKTASGRQFSKITGKGSGTLTVEDSFTITDAVNYAVGGKRATWDNVDSRLLFSADVKPGWTIETETDQTLTSTITVGISGSSSTWITLRGNSESTHRIINQSASNSSHFTFPNKEYWKFENIKCTNTHGSKNKAAFHVQILSIMMWKNCILGDSSNRLYGGIHRSAGVGTMMLINCDINNCTSYGILPDGAILNAVGCRFLSNSIGIAHPGINSNIEECLIYNNVGAGITDLGYYAYGCRIKNCTINGNGGDGIASSGGLKAYSIINNNITNNAGYGINAAVGQDAISALVDFNNFYNNTSGPYLNISAGLNDKALDPQYVDAANGNFTIQNTALIGTGFPNSNIGNSNTRSYVDFGAAQTPQTVRVFVASI